MQIKRAVKKLSDSLEEFPISDISAFEMLTGSIGKKYSTVIFNTKDGAATLLIHNRKLLSIEFKEQNEKITKNY